MPNTRLKIAADADTRSFIPRRHCWFCCLSRTFFVLDEKKLVCSWCGAEDEPLPLDKHRVERPSR